ncbi:hypothetical protein FA15DRAFT_595838, partial [Coprinopsis marcescibilis]
TTHTYLDGIAPFKYPELWVVEALHSTATLSPESLCNLYGVFLMHRLNIFLSRFGHSAGRALFFGPFPLLTLTLCIILP